MVSQTSDLWHCALPTSETIENKNQKTNYFQPRKSFDVRAFVVFDELVPNELDRFHPERIRPNLSFEESSCFCDEQALRKKQEILKKDHIDLH